MIDEMGSDTREVKDNWYSVFLEVLSWPNPGQHQKLSMVEVSASHGNSSTENLHEVNVLRPPYVDDSLATMSQGLDHGATDERITSLRALARKRGPFFEFANSTPTAVSAPSTLSNKIRVT
jgi:hypothetical protein